MNTIIALRGVANRGKTASIKRVYDLLKGAYSKAMFQEIVVGVDIQIIITIDGVKVGIESQGDPNSRLEESLEGFKKAKCDIIFCACRTRGMTVGWVNSLSPKYHIHFVAQTYTNSSRAASNAAMASSLMQMAGL